MSDPDPRALVSGQYQVWSPWDAERSTNTPEIPIHGASGDWRASDVWSGDACNTRVTMSRVTVSDTRPGVQSTSGALCVIIIGHFRNKITERPTAAC